MLSVTYYGSNAYSFRCDNELIKEGDYKFEVSMTLKKCGTVLEKEIIRSADTNEKIELWFVKAYNMGYHYCYELTFKDARLTRINHLGQCD
jgi:hypothetical protein